MLGLQSLSIRNTLVGGTIPRELANLPYLESVDVRDTRMTCCASLEVRSCRSEQGNLGWSGGALAATCCMQLGL